MMWGSALVGECAPGGRISRCSITRRSFVRSAEGISADLVEEQGAREDCTTQPRSSSWPRSRSRVIKKFTFDHLLRNAAPGYSW